jgi:hypothetical protein
VSAPFLAPHRDAVYKTGRAKRSGVTYYNIPGVSMGWATALTFTNNVDYYTPWVARTPLVIDRLATEITTSPGASNIRLGFYAADTDWQPIGAPLADSGSLDSSTTGVKTYTPGTPIFVPPGRYVSVSNFEVAGTAVRALVGSLDTPISSSMGSNIFVRGMKVTRTYAAFPTPGTVWDGNDVSVEPVHHVVVYRVLAA